MKLIKKISAALFAIIIILGTLTDATAALAAEVTVPNTTVLQNNFIKVTVDNSTGRFGIRTVEGQPIRKKDQNVDMLFRGDDPETSFTTFRIDGTDYIFGNPYKFAANFFSEVTKPQIVQNSNGTKQIETVWKIKGVAIKQILMLYMDAADKKNTGNVNVRYEVVNSSGAQVQLGARILLDTMVAGNDGPQFQIGTSYKAPLSVERKLVHDPAAIGIPEEDVPLYKLPAYWVMRDKLDLTNPLATNAMAYGFNNFAENNIHIVDEMIVGHWNGLANTKWDYTPNGNLDFTSDTNDYGTADSAVALYWNPANLANRATQSFETVYGLGEIIEPDKVFSIRYMDTPQQLATLEDNSAYADEGIFDITSEVENLPSFNMEHSSIAVKMELASGLKFVMLDQQGHIVRDSNGKALTEAFNSKELEFRKTATPEEAANDIQPKYKPGDTITASFKVIAKGKPWPTTQQYMLTASSPETAAKLDNILDKNPDSKDDEGIKAQYVSSKANFILLPAVGKAAATYAYGMSPKETYSSDVKYITVNLTNIEAYNTGNDTTDPNFDVYLKEKATGKRYKVPVKSVQLQTSNDGFSGDMNITYRGGDLVDKNGDVVQAGLGPELPLGEYQVELDFKGNAGGEADIAALLDMTTTQSFLVTDKQATRIREAHILAVYKQYVDISHVTSSMSGPALDLINSSYPGAPFATGTNLYDAVTAYKAAKILVGVASNATDPKFQLDDYLDDESLKKVAAYQYKLFDSEDDYNKFFDKEDFPNREMLVVVRGMIKQVGTGTEQKVVVDTKTEPAIINDSVAYSGKDMVFVKGKLDVFGLPQKVNGYNAMPFFDTLFVKGEGTLSVAGSGFIFYKGEWTLDFYNGFDKKLGDKYVMSDDVFPNGQKNEEDNSLNGTLKWAVGSLGDRLNPLRQLMLSNVYFNRHSLFAAPSFQISGFGLSFNDYILRPGGISFGGTIALKVVNAEIRNVIFNSKGFVGIDASLKFDLEKNIGLFDKKKTGGTNGEIYITHYVQEVPDVSNRYGIKFQADLKSIEVQAELGFKKVKDGRILPDVVAFGTTLPKPGVVISAATYLTAVRGALRELADTIAGGTSADPFPLVIQAGASVRFGAPPAFFFGDIDFTIKRTGLSLLGVMGYSPNAYSDKDDVIPMLTKALFAAQWVEPWFIRLEAEVDIGGWDLVMGKAGIFVGQNLEKHRIDFEGYLGAKVQIPKSVPVVGGLPLSSVFFGINNDKVWGSIGILFVSLGITYYWGGGVEFGTSSESLPEGLIHLVVNDPEKGPKLVVIGQGVETLATSWLDSEKPKQDIVYRDVAEGISMIDGGKTNVGIGGITVKNGGRVHEIPMGAVTGNAIIEMEYFDKEMPAFTLKDASGALYPIVYDNTNTNPNANAFTQFIPAVESSTEVDVRKAYIILPKEKLQNGGKWVLTAEKAVETKLLNLPISPQLKNVSLTKNTANANLFTAQWAVDNAKPGDTVNLYLTKDAVTADKTMMKNNKGEWQEVLDTGDAGMLIAKDLPVDKNGGLTGTTTSGNTEIDVTQVSMQGETQDIRGLLQQGNYYLRAELKSQTAFGTKTSLEKFEIVDPLAPSEVSDVRIEPAGNGYFALSFKPAAKKPALQNIEHSYSIKAFVQQNSKLAEYPNYGEVLLTEAEIADHWNAASGRYEGILVGGWTASTTSDEVDDSSLEPSPTPSPTPNASPGPTPTPDPTKVVHYTGLEVGKEYVIGVASVTKPTADLDKNEKYHYAGQIDSVKTLLPIPVKPKLTLQSGTYGDFISLLTKQTEQTVNLISDQKNIEVEAFYAEQSLGKTSFTNGVSGSSGTLHFDQFKTDGPYAIELVAINKLTKDRAATMLYITVDTLAPILYIDKPITGERTANGKINVSGRTSNDAVLKVNGTTIAVEENGNFAGVVNVASELPAEELTFTARDGAGNENQAVVSVTNDQFAAPVGLVLRNMPVLEPGKSTKIQAVLRLADGKDDQGKPKFKEIVVPAEKLSKLNYSVSTGEAVQVTPDGMVTGVAEGASIIEAKYEVSPGVSLESVTVATVLTPVPPSLVAITAGTSSVYGNKAATQIVVSSGGDAVGQQLVYKQFANGVNAAKPAYLQDISAWKYVPQNGVIAANAGDVIVVAARTSSDKLAVASSAMLPANIYSDAPSGDSGTGIGLPGGVPGGIPGTDPVVEESKPVLVNGQPVAAAKANDILTTHITKENTGSDGSDKKTISISSKETMLNGYTFKIDKSVAEQAISQGKTISIDVPMGNVVLKPDMLAGMSQDLEIRILPNSAADQGSLNKIASSVDAAALGGAQGVTIQTNIPEANRRGYMLTKILVPADVALSDITAMVLKGADGQWTTVPWKLDMVNNEAFVELYLPGDGSLSFVHSEKTFNDVKDGFWGKQSIHDAAAKLLVLGKEDETFSPESDVTRAEYPTMLLRAAGLMNKKASNGFSDVDAAEWYSRSVAIAAEMGIVTGKADGTFAPRSTLTRVEAMTMTGRILQVMVIGESVTDEEIVSILASFKDSAQIPEWARKSVALSIKNRIILGDGNSVHPEDALTRAQAAAIAVRLDRLITGN